MFADADDLQNFLDNLSPHNGAHYSKTGHPHLTREALLRDQMLPFETYGVRTNEPRPPPVANANEKPKGRRAPGAPVVVGPGLMPLPLTVVGVHRISGDVAQTTTASPTTEHAISLLDLPPRSVLGPLSKEIQMIEAVAMLTAMVQKKVKQAMEAMSKYPHHLAPLAEPHHPLVQNPETNFVALQHVAAVNKSVPMPAVHIPTVHSLGTVHRSAAKIKQMARREQMAQARDQLLQQKPRNIEIVVEKPAQDTPPVAEAPPTPATPAAVVVNASLVTVSNSPDQTHKHRPVVQSHPTDVAIAPTPDGHHLMLVQTIFSASPRQAFHHLPVGVSPPPIPTLEPGELSPEATHLDPTTPTAGPTLVVDGPAGVHSLNIPTLYTSPAAVADSTYLMRSPGSPQLLHKRQASPTPHDMQPNSLDMSKVGDKVSGSSDHLGAGTHSPATSKLGLRGASPQPVAKPGVQHVSAPRSPRSQHGRHVHKKHSKHKKRTPLALEDGEQELPKMEGGAEGGIDVDAVGSDNDELFGDGDDMGEEGVLYDNQHHRGTNADEYDVYYGDPNNPTIETGGVIGGLASPAEAPLNFRSRIATRNPTDGERTGQPGDNKNAAGASRRDSSKTARISPVLDEAVELKVYSSDFEILAAQLLRERIREEANTSLFPLKEKYDALGSAIVELNKAVEQGKLLEIEAKHQNEEFRRTQLETDSIISVINNLNSYLASAKAKVLASSAETIEATSDDPPPSTSPAPSSSTASHRDTTHFTEKKRPTAAEKNPNLSPHITTLEKSVHKSPNVSGVEGQSRRSVAHPAVVVHDADGDTEMVMPSAGKSAKHPTISGDLAKGTTQVPQHHGGESATFASGTFSAAPSTTLQGRAGSVFSQPLLGAGPGTSPQGKSPKPKSLSANMSPTSSNQSFAGKSPLPQRSLGKPPAGLQSFAKSSLGQQLSVANLAAVTSPYTTKLMPKVLGKLTQARRNGFGDASLRQMTEKARIMKEEIGERFDEHINYIVGKGRESMARQLAGNTFVPEKKSKSRKSNAMSSSVHSSHAAFSEDGALAMEASSRFSAEECIAAAVFDEIALEVAELTARRDGLRSHLAAAKSELQLLMEQLRVMSCGSEDDKYELAKQLLTVVTDETIVKPIAYDEGMSIVQSLIFEDDYDFHNKIGFRETKNIGNQVKEHDLRRAMAHAYASLNVSDGDDTCVDDIYRHEGKLQQLVRHLMVAVSNITMFHKCLKVEATCKQCFSVFTDPRTLWPCGHTFCSTCLPQLTDGDGVLICSECLTPAENGHIAHPTLELIGNYQRMNLVNASTMGDSPPHSQQHPNHQQGAAPSGASGQEKKLYYVLEQLSNDLMEAKCGAVGKEVAAMIAASSLSPTAAALAAPHAHADSRQVSPQAIHLSPPRH